MVAAAGPSTRAALRLVAGSSARSVASSSTRPSVTRPVATRYTSAISSSHLWTSRSASTSTSAASEEPTRLSAEVEAITTTTAAAATTITEAEPERSAPTLLPPTQYHPKTHGHHVATLHFSAHAPGPSQENLFFFIDFATRAAYALGIPVTRPSAQPTERSLWTVPKGPFVHKKSQENFERKISKRLIRVFDASEDVVDRWLHLLRIYEMPGVDMRAEIFRQRPLGIGKATLEAAKAKIRK
ncbi:unnamed protein product [Parajaminaea phylloscopi]